MSETKNLGHAERMANSVLRLMYWTGAWAATLAVLAAAPKLLWDHNLVLTVLACLVNAGVGVGMILANIRYQRDSDELQQKIFLDAAAITLGVGLVVGASYQLWKAIGLIAFEPTITHLIVLMSLTFLASTVFGHWRYR